MDGERHRFGIPVHGGPHPMLVAPFLGRLKSGHQGHRHAASGVGAGDGARPEPGDDGGGAAVGQRDGGIEVADFGVGHFPHFASVVANIGGQAGGAAPGRLFDPFALAGGDAHGVGVRVDRRAVGKLGRQFNQGFGNQHGHGVEVGSDGAQAQPLGFQGDGAAAAKGVVDGLGLAVEVVQHGVGRGRRRFVAGTGHGTGDFVAGRGQQGGVAAVFPLDQAFDEVVETLPLGALVGFGRKFGGAVGGVVHQASKDDGAAGGQGPARPPEMQSAGMPMPNGLLPRRFGVDGVQGQVNFDELAAMGGGRWHSGAAPGGASNAPSSSGQACGWGSRWRQ